MARMKTGRLTTKTTPPEKYIVTSKRETVQPRQLTSREAKYNTDEAAYSKYQSESAKYASEKAKFDKGNFGKMNTASKDYNAVFGGKQNMRKLNSTELAIWNADVKKNNPDLPEGYDVEIPKSVKAGEGSSFKPDKVMAYHTNYKAPTAPNKVNPPNSNDMPMGRMPLNKITSIKSKQSMAKGKEKPDPSDFVNPGKPRKIGKDISMNPLAGGAYTKGSGKRYVKQVIGSIGKTGENSRGYKKEERLFKAKASTGAANLDISDMSSKDIKGIRKDYLKKDLSAARTDNSLKPEERAKKIAAAKMEIKQSRQGQRYTTKMEKGKLSYFTPGYNEGKNKNEESRNDRGRIYEYKSSQDNINNKNTIDAKLKAIGEKAKSKPGSFGSMPTS